MLFFFFFQAEDGIRDDLVTGVQTCALPILSNLINPDIDNFYANTSEEGRLQLGLGPLEFERNKELIQRYLPNKGIVIDVGGGPGVYSEWLAGLGHQVYLIDPVEKHIKQANKRSNKTKKPFKSLLGEAQKLEL